MPMVKNNILNGDNAVDIFLKEWNDNNDSITAHTSGSTGTPKPIKLSKNDLKRSAHATNSFFEINHSDVLRCPLSCNYIAGKMMLVRALEANATVDFAKTFNEPQHNSRIKLMSVVPAQIDQLLESDEIASVDNLLIGGSPLSSQLESQLIDRNIQAWVSYGMTETCSHVAIRRCGYDNYMALPGITFDTDSRGCLIINAPQFNFAKITTNDIVNLVSNISFQWKGRADNVINSGGIKIFPEEIENKIRPFVDIDTQFYITGREHPRWGQAVTLVSDKPLSLPDKCIDALLPAERPKNYIIAKILRTKSGKIIRT